MDFLQTPKAKELIENLKNHNKIHYEQACKQVLKMEPGVPLIFSDDKYIVQKIHENVHGFVLYNISREAGRLGGCGQIWITTNHLRKAVKISENACLKPWEALKHVICEILTKDWEMLKIDFQ
jgi:hypothetical protein